MDPICLYLDIFTSVSFTDEDFVMQLKASKR